MLADRSLRSLWGPLKKKIIFCIIVSSETDIVVKILSIIISTQILSIKNSRTIKKSFFFFSKAMLKNAIDFIMMDRKHILRDVSVLNRFNTRYDHRLVRGYRNIDYLFYQI